MIIGGGEMFSLPHAVGVVILDDFLPVLHRLLCVMIDKLNTEDRKLFNSAFTAAPLYRIAREMGFEYVKDYLIA